MQQADGELRSLAEKRRAMEDAADYFTIRAEKYRAIASSAIRGTPL